MRRIRGGAALRAPLVTLRRVLVATLAMSAILIGLVAMHSAGMVHSDSHAESSASHELGGHSEGGPAAALLAGAPVTPAGEASASVSLLSCDENCLEECAMMALSCMVLFVLSSLIFLGRFPAVLRRLIDRGTELIVVSPRAIAHIYSPSLTVLSISRT